jgi:hypothetical protein
MDGDSVSVAAQTAVETLPKDSEGWLLVKPEIRVLSAIVKSLCVAGQP